MQQPDLATVCGRTIAAIDASLTSADRALLRARQLEDQPALYGDVLRRLPQDHPDMIWHPIVRSLGHLQHNIDERAPEDRKRERYRRSTALLLGEIGYSEARMSRLLTAKGRSLVNAVEYALQRLVSERSGSCRLTDLAVLVVADAIGDRGAYQWAKRRIAMDYSRGRDARERNKAA